MHNVHGVRWKSWGVFSGNEFLRDLEDSKGLVLYHCQTAQAQDSEDKGKNCGSEITDVEKSFSCHGVRKWLDICSEIILGGFCCLRDDLQILVFFARQGKAVVCWTLVETQGRKSHMWRHGFAVASLSFASLRPRKTLLLEIPVLKPLLSAPLSALFAPLHPCYFPIIFCHLVLYLLGFQDWVKSGNWLPYQVRPGPSFLFELPMCEHCCLFCLLPLIILSFLYCLGRVVGRGGFGTRWETFPGAICAFCLLFQLPFGSHHSF